MVTIRSAEGSDADGLRVLLDQLGYPATRERVVANLKCACDRGDVLVAIEGDELLGFASYQFVYFFEDGAPRCRLTAIAVRDTARMMGVGRRLLREVERLAHDAGCTAVEASSSRRPERGAAHRFYPALGFVDAHREGVFFTKNLRVDSP